MVPFQPLGELAGCFLGPVVAAGDEERLRGIRQCGGQCLGVCGAHAARRHRDGGVQGRIDLLADDVLRQAHHHRPRPPAHGREHGFRNNLGGALGVVEHHHALGSGVEPCLDIEFLERLAVAVRKGNEPHEEQHGRGVLPGGVQADVGVGCAGPARHHGNARTLVHFAVGLGHVGGAALVPANHGIDVGAVQPVQHVQEAFAGNHVGALDAVGHEGVDNHVPGGFQCSGVSRRGWPCCDLIDGVAVERLGVSCGHGGCGLRCHHYLSSWVGCWFACVGWRRRWRLVGFRAGAEEAAVLAAVRRLVFRWRPVGLGAQ